MKRILLITAILFMALTNGQAQVLNKDNTKQIGQAVKDGIKDVRDAILQDTNPTGEHEQWDIYAVPKIGLNLSNLPGIDGKVKIGLIGGVYMEMFLTKNIAIDVETQYSHQGSSGVHRTLTTTDASGVTTTREYGPYNFKLDYLNTNYIVRWYPWIDLPWSFTTGLHTGYIISAKAKLDDGTKHNLKDHIYKGDVAIPLGVSYEWSQWQIEARYNLYFRKLARDAKAQELMRNARNNMFEVTLGYRIKVL